MSTKRLLVICACIALGLLPLVIAGCVGIPDLTSQFSHQGRLLDDTGEPVADGNYTFRYRLFHVASGGTPVFTETKTVSVADGLFDAAFGTSDVITPDLFARPGYLELAVNGEVLAPRQRLNGAPFAFSLVPGAVVQGGVPITRTFQTFDDTGAALTVWNDDATITGGHGVAIFNQAAPQGSDRDKTAALWVKAAGGKTDAAPYSGSYGAIVDSENYRGLYAKGGQIDELGTDYAAAVFESDYGIILQGGGFCHGCALAYDAQNAGSEPIAAGDLVAVVGVVVDPDLNTPVMQVRKAASASDVIVGVASGALARSPVGDYYGVKTGGYNPQAGAAASGDYLSVVVQGLAQVNAGGAALQIGDWLALQDGQLAAAPAGVARVMSAPGPDGRIWVLFGGN